MLSAIVVEGDRVQFVFTPENDFERNLINTAFRHCEQNAPVKVFSGGFYKCHGGWTRENMVPDSLMLVVDKKVEDVSPTGHPDATLADIQ